LASPYHIPLVLEAQFDTIFCCGFKAHSDQNIRSGFALTKWFEALDRNSTSTEKNGSMPNKSLAASESDRAGAFLAPRVRHAKPSPTAEISNAVRRLQSTGRAVINLGEGELDFETPRHIQDAGIDAIRAGQTKYTPVSGTAALKQAIIGKFRNENGLKFEPGEVIAGAGAKQIIFSAFLATVCEGDEVVLPAPYWVSYPDMVRLADGTPVVLNCDENSGWKVRPEQLAAAITPRTRWVVLNSPSNPTGAIYSARELRELADVLLTHPHVLVLSDDIYEHIRYAGDFATIAAVEPRLKERVLTVNGVSKAYSMTGWRLGYAGGPKWLIAAIDMLHSQSTSNPSSISQAATICALETGTQFLEEWIAELRARRDLAAGILNAAQGLRTAVPEGAFYLFVNCTGTFGKKMTDGKVIGTDLDFANYLLDSVGVGTVHGSAFGTPGYIRVAYAIDREILEKACRMIVEACGNLH
jgi:aspartate aminotransferase